METETMPEIQALLDAKPGTALVYHRGYLAYDRTYNVELDQMARQMMAHSTALFVHREERAKRENPALGYLHLFAVPDPRMDMVPRKFSYIAIRSSKK